MADKPIETHLVQLDAKTQAIVSFSKDGKGKKWKEVGEYTAKVPPINGRKGARKGWLYEWKLSNNKEKERYVIEKCENGRLPK